MPETKHYIYATSGIGKYIPSIMTSMRLFRQQIDLFRAAAIQSRGDNDGSSDSHYASLAAELSGGGITVSSHDARLIFEALDDLWFKVLTDATVDHVDEAMRKTDAKFLL